jgi:hypothetical protein
MRGGALDNFETQMNVIRAVCISVEPPQLVNGNREKDRRVTSFQTLQPLVHFSESSGKKRRRIEMTKVQAQQNFGKMVGQIKIHNLILQFLSDPRSFGVCEECLHTTF